MKKSTLLIILWFLVFGLTSVSLLAQEITIKEEGSDQGLENINLLSPEGEVLGSTDFYGKIDMDSIKKSSFYVLYHPNIEQDTLEMSKVVNNTFWVKSTDAVQLSNMSVIAGEYDYYIVEGNFTSYVTNNGFFNGYTEGVVQYVFDNKKNKLKEMIVLQYRSYILKSENKDRKDISSNSFDGLLRLPELDDLKIWENTKKDFKTKYSKENDVTSYEYEREKLTKKEFKFFGYWFKNAHYTLTSSFSGDRDLNPKNLTRFTEEFSIQLKHKSEENYSTLNGFTVFQPMDILFANKGELKMGVNFDRRISNYTSDFWNTYGFSSMTPYLSQQFGAKFQEQKNIRKK